MKEDYIVGRQPCNNFKPDDGSLSGIMNEHECPRCLFTVSFCLNCYKDHHYKGWDLCDKIANKYEINYKYDL